MALDAMAYHLLRKGECEEAAGYCRQLLESFADSENIVARMITYSRVALSLYCAGSIDEARTVARKAATIAGRAGARHMMATATEVLALIMAHEQRTGEALEAMDSAVETLQQTETLTALATGLLTRAAIHDKSENTKPAEQDRERARQILSSSGAAEWQPPV